MAALRTIPAAMRATPEELRTKGEAKLSRNDFVWGNLLASMSTLGNSGDNERDCAI